MYVFLFSKTSTLALGHTQDSFLALKQLRHKVEYLSQSSAKIKNEWSYTSAPLYAFMVWTGATLPFYLYLTFLFIL